MISSKNIGKEIAELRRDLAVVKKEIKALQDLSAKIQTRLKTANKAVKDDKG